MLRLGKDAIIGKLFNPNLVLEETTRLQGKLEELANNLGIFVLLAAFISSVWMIVYQFYEASSDEKVKEEEEYKTDLLF